MLPLTPSRAAAKSSKAKIAKVTRGSQGVTLTLKLDNAPFPQGSKPYGDPSVVVFVPDYYRLPKKRRVDMVVHFHGHNTTAMVAMQRPVRATDSSAGRLERNRGLKKMLVELLRVLRSAAGGKALGASSVAGNKGAGHLCVSAHSGGYRAAAFAVSKGGIDVKEVYLFDALYSKVDTFRRWLLVTKGKKGRRRHKLISHYAGGKVRKNNLALLAKLEKTKVRCIHETKPGQITRDQLVKGDAIFVASTLSHGAVAVTHNNLRDCLFASGMKRFVRSKWFKDKHAPRKIDRRS